MVGAPGTAFTAAGVTALEIDEELPAPTALTASTAKV